MKKIKTIINKEWSEVFKQRLVLFTVLFMPLIFTAMAIGLLFAIRTDESEAITLEELPGETEQLLCPPGTTGGDCLTIYIASQFMLLFMMTPVIIPTTIASYSIVGEKATHSLEPLLATPITTSELLIGKGLAAMLPAIGASWLAFLLYLIAIRILATPAVFNYILGPVWLMAIFLIGPLMALLSVTFSLMVSSRVTDPRVAEQLAGVVIVPILLLLFGQVTGFVVLNQLFMFIFALIILVLDALSIYLAVRIFQREAILTKWK